VLVNCAGGSVLEDVPVNEMSLDIWHKKQGMDAQRKTHRRGERTHDRAEAVSVVGGRSD
jgi:hypothetical protein